MAWSVNPVDPDECKHCGHKFPGQERLAKVCELSHKYDAEAEAEDKQGQRRH